MISPLSPSISFPEHLKNKSQEKSAEPVHSIGDTVMHPSEGICVIDQIERRLFNASYTTYYVLKPQHGKSSSTVYLPVERGNTLLRDLLEKAEIDQIISKSTHCPTLWIEDNKLRKKTFSELLLEGDYVKLIRMIRDIHEHNAMRIADGKKPCAADEAVLQEAENILHQEFAYSLNLPIEEIGDYIRMHLEDEVA